MNMSSGKNCNFDRDRRRRKKLFAKLDYDPVRLKTKADSYCRRGEWNKALGCLNRLLDDKDVDFGPNDNARERLKSLLLRGRVRLFMDLLDEAASDSKTVLTTLSTTGNLGGQPFFDLKLKASALRLFADSLFQKGHFEHALVLYHRGNRLTGDKEDEFKFSIDKAVSSITASLPPIIMAKGEDSIVQVESDQVDQVGPRQQLSVAFADCSSYQRGRKVATTGPPSWQIRESPPRAKNAGHGLKVIKCSESKSKNNHFKQDLAALKEIKNSLEVQASSKLVLSEAADALRFVKGRSKYWKHQAAPGESRPINGDDLMAFLRRGPLSNLTHALLEDDNPLVALNFDPKNRGGETSGKKP